MPQPRVLGKREFLRWIARVGVVWAAYELAVPSLLRVNTVVLAKGGKAKGCKQDVCTTRDGCDGDAAGHRCRVKDVCDVDESGDCRVDECGSDSSGGCAEDACDSDSSGDCTADECRGDSSGACTTDECVADSSKSCTGDACTSDSSGDCGQDACVDDSSGDCEGDACVSDRSGACTPGDTCVSDKSGDCRRDACVSDSSGECGDDACRSDSSGECTADSCTSDSSGECADDQCTGDSSKSCSEDECDADASGECGQDGCVSDSSGGCDDDGCLSDQSGGCTGDDCRSDKSGECAGDDCVSDSSGECTVRDACVRDVSGTCGSDDCRDDRSPDCPVSDTCSQDVAMDASPRGERVASNELARSLRWLYGLSGALLLAASGATARGGTVIDVSDAAFVPRAVFETGKPLTVASPAGPFLRDADGDGILEADVNGDGAAEGDPEVKDHDGDGTRELPPGTPFAGTLEFTCFHVPADVALVATGPVTIRASVEVAVFGVIRAASGIEIACLGPIDVRTSAWVADGGSISLATALAGEVIDEPTGLVGEDGVGVPEYVCPCETPATTARRAGPREGTIGSEIALWVTNTGTRKGKVAIGTAKAKVLLWSPHFVVCTVKKVPRTGVGAYALTVRPKEPKKAPLLDVPGGFDVRGPVLDDASSGIAEPVGDGAEWVARGRFFGVKRGRVTLDGKRCRVTRWTMNPSTGASEVRFILPAGLAGGASYTLAVVNRLGSASGSLDLPSDEPEPDAQ